MMKPASAMTSNRTAPDESALQEDQHAGTCGLLADDVGRWHADVDHDVPGKSELLVDTAVRRGRHHDAAEFATRPLLMLQIFSSSCSANLRIGPVPLFSPNEQQLAVQCAPLSAATPEMMLPGISHSSPRSRVSIPSNASAIRNRSQAAIDGQIGFVVTATGCVRQYSPWSPRSRSPTQSHQAGKSLEVGPQVHRLFHARASSTSRLAGAVSGTDNLPFNRHAAIDVSGLLNREDGNHILSRHCQEARAAHESQQRAIPRRTGTPQFRRWLPSRSNGPIRQFHDSSG